MVCIIFSNSAMNRSPYNDKQSRNLNVVNGYPKRRKLQLVGVNPHRVISANKQIYSDSNPYSLAINRQASTPFIYRTSPDTYRDNYTETSSQKSKRIIGKNVLRKASKPNLSGSRAHLQSSYISQKGNSPMRSGWHKNQHEHQQYQDQRNHLLSKKLKISESENTELKQQNSKLRQQMKIMSQQHQIQLQKVNNRVQAIFQLYERFYRDFEAQKKQWHDKHNRRQNTTNIQSHISYPQQKPESKNCNYNYNYNILMTNDHLKQFYE